MSRVVVVASHRRSGTHLTIDTLLGNTRDVRRPYLNLDRIEPAHAKHLPIAEFDAQLRRPGGTVLVKTHALPDPEAWHDPAARAYALELLAASPTIYVHRDGRDVLVSLYHFIQGHSSDVASQPFGEFIRGRHTGGDVDGLSRTAYWQHHVLRWLERGPTVLAPYEGLQGDLAATLRPIAEAVGLPLRSRIRAVPLRRPETRPSLPVRMLARLGIRRRPPSSAIAPRVGRSGGWRETFDDADLAFFHSEAAEAMRRLGYP